MDYPVALLLDVLVVLGAQYKAYALPVPLPLTVSVAPTRIDGACSPTVTLFVAPILGLTSVRGTMLRYPDL